MLPNGAPPESPVRVSLTFQGRHIYETFTDLSGRFSFSGLKVGAYQLTAEGDGQTFETTTVDAEISTFGGFPQVFTQNIPLRLKEGARLPPAGVIAVEELDASIPDGARKAYRQGVKNAASDKPERAVKFFQEAIAAYAQFYAAHIALGEQLSRLKRYDEAIAAFQKATELKPDRALAYTDLGAMLIKQKRYGEALTALRRSITLNDKTAAVYLYLGFAEMMTNDLDGAERDLRRALEIGKPAVAHIYLANIYELRKEPAKAIAELEAFIKENPNSQNEAQVREAIKKLRKQTVEKR